MKRFWMTSATAVFLICIGAGSARAGGVVFDPINYIENYATAISNVEQYAQQVDQYVTQLQQLKYQVQSLKNLDPSAVGGILQTANLDKQLQEYQQLQGALYNTYGSLSSVKHTLNDTNSLLSGQGLDPFTQKLSWKQYENAEVKIGKKQGEAASQAMTNTYQQIKSANGNITQLKKITAQVQKNGQSASMKAEMETMNSSLTLIARQNQQMLGAMLPLTMLKENKLRQEADEKQKNAAYNYKREKAKEKAYSNATNGSGGYLACSGAGHFSYTESQKKILRSEGIDVAKCPSAPVQSTGSAGTSSHGGGH